MTFRLFVIISLINIAQRTIGTVIYERLSRVVPWITFALGRFCHAPTQKRVNYYRQSCLWLDKRLKMKRRDFPLRVHLQSGASFCHEAIVTHVIFRHVVLAFLSLSFSLSLSLSLLSLSLSLSLLQTEQFTVLWLLFAMIVVGNIAVLIGLLWGKRRKTRMDFFIKQLAFAGKFCYI